MTDTGMGMGVEVETESAAKVELKICERCGGLWLRPANSDWIYCRLCKQQVSELPHPKLRKRASARVAVGTQARAARRSQ